MGRGLDEERAYFLAAAAAGPVRRAAGAGGGARERATPPRLEPELLGWALPALGARGEGGVQYVGLREGGSPWRIELGRRQAGVLRVVPASPGRGC